MVEIKTSTLYMISPVMNPNWSIVMRPPPFTISHHHAMQIRSHTLKLLQLSIQPSTNTSSLMLFTTTITIGSTHTQASLRHRVTLYKLWFCCYNCGLFTWSDQLSTLQVVADLLVITLSG